MFFNRTRLDDEIWKYAYVVSGSYLVRDLQTLSFYIIQVQYFKAVCYDYFQAICLKKTGKIIAYITE